jgi:hypothetical protein
VSSAAGRNMIEWRPCWQGRRDVGCPMGQVGACVLSGRVGGGRRNVCWHGWRRAVQGTRGEVVTRRGETRQLGEGEGKWCGASGRDDVREDSQLEDVGSGSECGVLGASGARFRGYRSRTPYTSRGV